MRLTCFQLVGQKAPGPDGFSGQFYQFSWDGVGNMFFEVVRKCLEGGVGLQEINKTDLVMVPKVDKPENVG